MSGIPMYNQTEYCLFGTQTSYQELPLGAPVRNTNYPFPPLTTICFGDAIRRIFVTHLYSFTNVVKKIRLDLGPVNALDVTILLIELGQFGLLSRLRKEQRNVFNNHDHVRHDETTYDKCVATNSLPIMTNNKMR
jgi:hypothetical protein